MKPGADPHFVESNIDRDVAEVRRLDKNKRTAGATRRSNFQKRYPDNNTSRFPLEYARSVAKKEENRAPCKILVEGGIPLAQPKIVPPEDQ